MHRIWIPFVRKWSMEKGGRGCFAFPSRYFCFLQKFLRYTQPQRNGPRQLTTGKTVEFWRSSLLWKYLWIPNQGFIGISRGFPFSYTCILSYPWNFSAGLPHYERHLQPILHLIRNQLHSFCWHMPRKDSDAVSRASDESKQGNVKTGIGFCIPLFSC